MVVLCGYSRSKISKCPLETVVSSVGLPSDVLRYAPSVKVNVPYVSSPSSNLISSCPSPSCNSQPCSCVTWTLQCDAAEAEPIATDDISPVTRPALASRAVMRCFNMESSSVSPGPSGPGWRRPDAVVLRRGGALDRHLAD